MPSTYAHYKFGQQVYEALPASIKKYVDISPQLYNIGQHGPDILFYYNAIIPNRINRIGYGMHHLPADEFFRSALNVLENAEEDRGERAYIYGFVCHYILDSVCHWYVDEAMVETGAFHTEVEGEFDRMLMVKDLHNPITYPITQHIIPSEENARVIGEFFPEITASQANVALKDFLSYNRLFLCPHKLKRGLLRGVFAVTGLRKPLGGMIIRLKPDTRCKKSIKNLEKLFNVAQTEALKYLVEFEAAIDMGRPLSDRFSRTFGPDKESKEEYEAYIT